MKLFRHVLIFYILINFLDKFESIENSKQLNARVRTKKTTTTTTAPDEELIETQDYELNQIQNLNESRIVQECIEPSINDFPADLFSQKQRRFGAIIFHLLFAFYLFYSIMIVCDEYFMSSLELIGLKFNLDQDVTGATFMAAGSSAPEVIISLIGIFVSGSEPGIGSIVGSAIFNILFVVGICGLFIAGSAKLSVWPFIRDSFFYSIAILVLVVLIRDDKVYWYESLALLVVYGLYIFFMMKNDKLKNWAYLKFKMLQEETNNIIPGSINSVPHNKNYGFRKTTISDSPSGYNRFNDDEEMYAWGGTLDNIADQSSYSYQNSYQYNSKTMNSDLLNADYMIASGTRQIDFDTAVLQVMLSNKFYFRGKTRFRMSVRRVIDELKWLKNQQKNQNSNSTNPNLNNFDLNPLNRNNYNLFLFDMPDIQQDGFKNFFKWILFLPIKVLLYFTIPDCRVDKYKKWFMLTFLLSVLWLAILSYLMIWMITVIGYTLAIPDSLMAITFIAAGSSIPDAYSSIVVVRQNMVDMGVSNIIGSNVFDLLIGLALPWFIKSLFNNGYVKINSNGLSYDAVLLYACVLTTVLVIHFRKWILDRRSGYVFLSIYAAFIIFSSAIELNMFSYVNPPMCL